MEVVNKISPIMKEIYDPIHGFIDITPLMQSIIYTWEFHRLYDLHQLGGAYLVYPSAVHKRSEHSFGVSYLAGVMAENLSKCPEVEEDEDGLIIKVPGENGIETLCVERERFVELCRIAGLIHDIGHGPYSHLYDTHIKLEDEPPHEERGVEIFERMCSEYKFELTSLEICIIKTMVLPPSENNISSLWYYQIIANKVCDIDVDKIDYILRDSFHTGLGYGGEWSRLLTKCIVRDDPQKDGIKTIVWSYKLKDEIFQLFATRYRLHKNVCTHHTVKAYEFIIIDMLKGVREKVDDFLLLTDSVISCRINNEFREMQIAIARKQIPLLIEERVVFEDDKLDLTYPYNKSNLIIDRFEIGLSSGNKNPLNLVLYEDKQGNIHNMGEDEGGLCAPKLHKETIMRIYTREPHITDSALEETRKFWESCN
jgi:HD superfamily phosphohydrolase